MPLKTASEYLASVEALGMAAKVEPARNHLPLGSG